jgi:hypothetical protein
MNVRLDTGPQDRVVMVRTVRALENVVYNGVLCIKLVLCTSRSIKYKSFPIFRKAEKTKKMVKM